MNNDISSNQQTEIKFSLCPEKEITLVTAPGVFTPTGTTNLLIQAVQKRISGLSTLLDLGCGTGIVGLSLCLQGLVKPPLYASDLSNSAVQCSRKNFDRYGYPAEVRSGSLFEPWIGKKFDVIVDDISGVAQDVAMVSPWFEGIPSATGRDGTDLIVNVLRNASNYLKEGGQFFFPILSLSNVDLLLEEAKKGFGKVEMVSRLEWPLPVELKSHMALLKTLEGEGCIKLQERFGMVLCYTEVYCATNA
jgi:hypothetical protein